MTNEDLTPLRPTPPADPTPPEEVRERSKAPTAFRVTTQICAERVYSFLMHPELPFRYYDEVRREAAEWILHLTP